MANGKRIKLPKRLMRHYNTLERLKTAKHVKSMIDSDSMRSRKSGVDSGRKYSVLMGDFALIFKDVSTNLCKSVEHKHLSRDMKQRIKRHIQNIRYLTAMDGNDTESIVDFLYKHTPTCKFLTNYILETVDEDNRRTAVK